MALSYRITAIISLIILIGFVVYIGLFNQNQGLSYILIIAVFLGVLFYVTISVPAIGKQKHSGAIKRSPEEDLPEEKDEKLKEKRDELVLDLIKRRYDSELQRVDSIDSKGGNLIGFVSVVVGILVGIAGLEFIEKLILPLFSIPYFIGLSLLIVSISCSLYAIKVRKYRAVPEVSRLMNRYIEAEYRLVLRRVASTMQDSINKSEIQNNIKAKWIDMSWYFLIGGLLSIVIFIALIAATGEVQTENVVFPSPRYMPV